MPNKSYPCFLDDYGGGRGGYSDDYDNGERLYKFCVKLL